MQRLPLQRSPVGLGFLGMLLLVPAVWAQTQESIGRVTAMVGQATVLQRGRFTPERLVLQTPVYEEGIIETAGDSKVRITLIDTTIISLGEHSRLELKQFLYDARQQTRTSRLSLSAGIFRAIVNKLIPQSTFEIITPTAVAAIRGTDLMGEVTVDSTAIVVLDGTVLISNVRPRFRGLTTLTPGAGTTVTADQPPSAVTQWSASRIEALRNATSIQ